MADSALQILSRIGDLGEKEVILPNDPAVLKKYGLPPNSTGKYDQHNNIIYLVKGRDEDTSRKHERVHRGQMLFLKKNPNLGNLLGLAPGRAIQKLDAAGYRGRELEYEWPSYAFEDDNKDRKKTFYRYLDLVRRLNPQSTSQFEAHLPQELMRQTVATQPMPNYYPKPQLNEENFWDFIKRMVK